VLGGKVYMLFEGKYVIPRAANLAEENYSVIISQLPKYKKNGI
jgi:hypothetical protein